MDLFNWHYLGACFELEWTQIKLIGKDSEAFIQGQTTNDVSTLKEKEFHLSALLNLKGQIESYFFLLKDNGITLFVPKELTEQTVQRLEKFIIMEDVELEASSASLNFSISADNKYKGLIFGQSCSFSFETGANLAEEDFFQYLALFGFFPEQVNKSITESTLLHESVSFSKGCYLGQEIVSKIHNNRGASFYPVLLEGKIDRSDIVIEGRKRGEVIKSFCFNSQTYSLCLLFRDLRVQGKEIRVNEEKFKVHLFPFVPTNNREKAQALYYYGVELFTKKNEEEKAKKILYRVIEIDPSFADAYESLGVIYGRHEEYDKAINLMKDLIKVDESSVMAHTNLSLYYMKQGKIEEAEEEKTKATIKTFKKYGDEAQEKKRVEELNKQKEEDLNRREGMFKQVLDLDPEDTLANYGLGEIALERSLYSDAISYLEKVLESDPKYSVAYLALGKSYMKNKDSQKAVEVFKKGIEIAASKGDMMPANEMQSLMNSLLT